MLARKRRIMKSYLMLSLGMIILFFNNDAHYVSSQKYKSVIDKTVDRYVDLCNLVETKHLCKIEIVMIRILHFQDPCIINCYNKIVRTQSVKPLCHLWGAYKDGTIECDKDRFMYEFCHLIFILFEQFAIHLMSEYSGESPESMQEFFDKVEIEMPIDELIDILEKCYQRLSDIIVKLDQLNFKTNSKRWIIAIVSVAFIIKKVYEHFYQKEPIVSLSAQV